ncbi:hypothetical protein l11_09260 [Neisseria weaveri LMG 5135]|nr:hypothetical protein l13_15820 [Neisseria weaveri ATCC 51223]EGV37685.1 hypothetical protein l11_09260 [Neisseria weaveri LMG 5135]
MLSLFEWVGMRSVGFDLRGIVALMPYKIQTAFLCVEGRLNF